MTTSSRVALKAGGTQMNGEISGKKIQNMDIMEVRKNKYIFRHGPNLGGHVVIYTGFTDF